jgi:tRNA U34 5-methylaminomethyl-2-thiouridine-forming methyltransferase MnmC
MTDRGEIAIFEVGFGTGLNAALSFLSVLYRGIRATYHTLEKYPIDPDLAVRLNYESFLVPSGLPEGFFAKIHQVAWNTTAALHPSFHLHKIRDDLTTFQPDFRYDLIFFDAFAPEKQPALWTREIFDRLYRNLNDGGILTTYCAKGSIRRMLQHAGFRVDRLPGPPGKREMLRAQKNLH